MDVGTSFGRWLRMRRRALDFTQDRLARLAGCAVITIQKLEADERRPSLVLVERLLDNLQLTQDERTEIITLARAEPYRPPEAAEGVERALPAPSGPAANLPTPLTRLIGRKKEIAAVRTMLLNSQLRLLTLAGPPGIGKTRLSIEVTRDVQAVFKDGACFIQLAPLGDASLVLPTIAQALDVKETPGQPLLNQLKAALHAQRLLLVLDNFEHLLEAAPAIVELLEACPGCKALVTSRAALHVRGEQLYTVPPLLLPDDGQRSTRVKLARTPAVMLFLERARAVAPHFRLTSQNAETVAAICVRLEGLPLAIELAATRIKLLPPEILLARLEGRLALLTDGGLDLPLRHRTLRAAIAWSYELLDEDEQRLFRGLGVFVGGCTLEAAESVLAGSNWQVDGTTVPLPRHAVFDGLLSLIDKSLLRQEGDMRAEPRLTLLETIREYALEQLALSGEAETLRHRHAAYYLKLAEAAEPHVVYGPDQVLWSDRLEADHDNLRAVLTWSAGTQETEALSLRLAGALSWFWVVRSHFSEGYRWLNAMLERLDVAEPAVRAKILRAAGLLAENFGEFARTYALINESLALYRELGDTAGATQALVLLGRIKEFQGEYSQARSLLTESMALAGAQQNTWTMIWGFLGLGDIALDNGEFGEAEEYFRRARDLCLEQGDQFAGAWAVVDLGRVAERVGDATRAKAYYEESLAAFRQLGQQRDIADLYLDMGRLARTQGQVAQAQRYYAEGLAVFGELMDKRAFPPCLEGIAALAAMVEQPARAARLFGAAQTARQVADLPIAPVDRAAYARDVAAGRVQLNGAAWDAAWAEGAALEPERAIAEARQALREVEAMVAKGQV